MASFFTLFEKLAADGEWLSFKRLAAVNFKIERRW